MNNILLLMSKPTYKLTIDQVREIFRKHNFELLDTEYFGIKWPLLVKCLICSYTYKKQLNNLSTGYGCIQCGKQSSSDKQKFSFDEIKKFADSINLTLLSTEYKTYQSELKFKCEFGHYFEKSFGNLKRTPGCPKCKLGIGINEEICRKFFEYLFDVVFVKSHPKWLKGLELDGYNKELELAFEYSGRQHYQYNPKFHKTKAVFEAQQKRDRVKEHLCKENGVTLIVIPYTVKSDKILSFIKEKCDKLNIAYFNKPDVTISGLGIFSENINAKNKIIDDLLKNTTWKRASNYCGTDNKMTLQCTNCEECCDFGHYSMVKGLKENKPPKCENCHKLNKQQEIEDILHEHSWVVTGTYKTYKDKITFECGSCGFERSHSPRDIISKTIRLDCIKCIDKN
jgi:hypothetical protein